MKKAGSRRGSQGARCCRWAAKQRCHAGGVRAHGRTDRHLPVQSTSSLQVRDGGSAAACRPSTISPCLWHGAPRSSRSARRSPWSPSSCSSASRPGSLGILAEAVHSGVDAGAALLTLWAVGVADRPADPQHPYGHGKAQNLSALGEAAILVLLAAWIAVSAIDAPRRRRRERCRRPGTRSRCSAVVLVIDATRATASARAARSEGSAALGANAVHFACRLRRHARRHGGPRADGARSPTRRCHRRPLRRRARRLRRRAARRAPT